MVETNGNQCDVRQEGEHDDESMKVGLSFKDRVGARNACSLYRGSSTPCSERLDHERALMVKFKGKCPATEQYEPFKELIGLSFFRTVSRRTDGWAGTRGRRCLLLTHGCTVRRWTLGHREGRVSGRSGRQTCVTVGRSGGRSIGRWSVRRSEERRDGRADGRSIEQILVAVGRTVRRPTVKHTDGGKGGSTVDGRTCRQSEGRSGGRAVQRAGT